MGMRRGVPGRGGCDLASMFGAVLMASALAGCASTSEDMTLSAGTATVQPLTTASVTPAIAGVEPDGRLSGLPLQNPGPTGPSLAALDARNTLDEGRNHYRIGNFGRAAESFRMAVEKEPTNMEAVLGLAASYDRLRRFDLADRAYQTVIKGIGLTAEVLNNRGYSYMLRGEFKKAYNDLIAARRQRPTDPVIEANLRRLYDAAKGVRTVN